MLMTYHMMNTDKEQSRSEMFDQELPVTEIVQPTFVGLQQNSMKR